MKKQYTTPGTIVLQVKTSIIAATNVHTPDGGSQTPSGTGGGNNDFWGGAKDNKFGLWEDDDESADE